LIGIGLIRWFLLPVTGGDGERGDKKKKNNSFHMIIYYYGEFRCVRTCPDTVHFFYCRAMPWYGPTIKKMNGIKPKSSLKNKKVTIRHYLPSGYLPASAIHVITHAIRQLSFS
jgi:hypothetical protein